MSISLYEINNEIVRPTHYLYGGSNDLRQVKGESLFPEVYANIFILAKKKSGKSVVVNKIIRSCSTIETTVIVFASTVDRDKEHLAIKKYCDNKGIGYIGYTSMEEDGVNVLDILIQKLQDEAKDNMDIEEEHKSMNLFDSDDEDEEPKKRKSKYLAPEYILVFDDISNELRNRTLEKLMKMNRHYKMKVIISSQYCNDLLPSEIKQLDYCLVFRGETDAKLEKLHKDLDLSINFELFKKVYKYATQKMYSFLYIDVRQEKYRKNFNYEYKINETF